MKNVSYIVLIDANSSCVVVILLGGIPTEVGLLSGLTLLHLHSNSLTVSSSIVVLGLAIRYHVTKDRMQLRSIKRGMYHQRLE